MKKIFALVAVGSLAVTAAHAQSAEQRTARTGEAVERVAPANTNQLQPVKRLDNSAISTQSTTTAARPQMSPEKIDASILMLENRIRENEAKEGFDKAAYEQRLQYLRSLKSSNQ